MAEQKEFSWVPGRRWEVAATDYTSELGRCIRRIRKPMGLDPISSKKGTAYVQRAVQQAETFPGNSHVRRILLIDNQPAGFFVYNLKSEEMLLAMMDSQFKDVQPTVESLLQQEGQRLSALATRQDLKGSWDSWWEHSRAKGNPERYFARLLECYAEPERHVFRPPYLRHCLDQFRNIEQRTEKPLVLELAVWFHRLRYIPASLDNFSESAVIVQQVVQRTGLPEEYREAAGHIKALSGEPQGDGLYLADIRQSVLALDPKRFQRLVHSLERQLGEDAQETLHREFSQQLQAPIFTTDHFRKRYEHVARKNMERYLQNHGQQTG